MNKYPLIVLGFMLLLATICRAELLQGGVSQDETPVLSGGTLTTDKIPAAPQRPTLSGQTQSSLLEGNVAGMFPTVTLVPQQPQTDKRSHVYQGGINHQISVLGMVWTFSNPSRVLFVEPASDVFGQVLPGDLLLDIDGINPNIVRQTRANYGNEDTAMILHIWRSGREFRIPCHRHPVAYFSPQFQAGLLPL